MTTSQLCPNKRVFSIEMDGTVNKRVFRWDELLIYDEVLVDNSVLSEIKVTVNSSEEKIRDLSCKLHTEKLIWNREI